ncbi:hypothetical protein ERO13_D03G022151v2 [Gossypium hirsutum]|uniref:Uncharacterized protein n=2 Tax=Gossypium TaxID=3633 RepID=A0A5D2LHP9_GOSTO|nr:hypothetical protein ERO13_D03G022151v2 [Gossypium hirsutum]TYG75369.1 hypothetical protein ES288_D03G025200v1 [Gossypium darwinii]TYH78931.1 hypothetical protein ES332_D03G024900v1 [Gossypium tomentosum]
MDQYQKVEKPKAETPINENELRIIVQGRMRNYISYAMTLLQEKGAKKIVLKATGLWGFTHYCENILDVEFQNGNRWW